MGEDSIGVSIAEDSRDGREIAMFDIIIIITCGKNTYTRECF